MNKDLIRILKDNKKGYPMTRIALILNDDESGEVILENGANDLTWEVFDFQNLEELKVKSKLYYKIR